MFNISKYTKWYYNIIKRASAANRQKGCGEYYELHHIIPTSLGGNNTENNKVLLTAREHFICHWLLTKMVESKKDKWRMINAVGCMMWMKSKNHSRYRITARIYEQLKKKHSLLKSWAQTGRKGHKHTEESKRKISEANKGKTAWNKGTVGICAGQPGMIHTEEAKEKIKQARAKQVIKHSTETKEKMSIAAKKRWALRKKVSQ